MTKPEGRAVFPVDLGQKTPLGLRLLLFFSFNPLPNYAILHDIISQYHHVEAREEGMNLRKPFIEKDTQRIHDFIASIAFATFISVGENNEPVASHLPVNFVPSEGKYGMLIAHLANNNPHVNFLTPERPLLVIFASTDAYISPSWFADRASAPTQAQRVVHCYGRPRVIRDIASVRSIMEQQVRSREKDRPGQWHTDELGEEGYIRRLRAISGIEMPIDRMLASFRLMQDETDGRNVQAAVRELEKAGNAPLAQCIAEANRNRP